MRSNKTYEIEEHLELKRMYLEFSEKKDKFDFIKRVSA